jgi:hypothetical protein
VDEDARLGKFFACANVGVVKEPAVILDDWGNILAWHLPDIISSGRVVSFSPVFKQTEIQD